MLSRYDFLKLEADLFSGWGQGLIFFQQLKLDIFDKVKAFIFLLP